MKATELFTQVTLKFSNKFVLEFWNYKTCRLLHDWSKMKKIIILIPVYNDWQSLIKLLDEINNTVKNLKGFLFDCIIINDASTQSLPPFKNQKF